MSAGRKSAATWNAPSSSTRATCSARSTRTSSACPAASRTACWCRPRGAPPPGAGGADRRRHGAGWLSAVAAAAFAPIILGASPALLEVDSFADLAMVDRPRRAVAQRGPRPLAQPGDARGHALPRRRPAARAGAPALAGRSGARADGFRYAEYAPDATSRVWMTAGYAFAAVVARAFAQYAWPADVRGVETDRVGGGLVTDLPVEPFRTDPDRVWVRAAARDRADRPAGARAGRCRADAAVRAAATATSWCSARCAACRCRQQLSRRRRATPPTPTRGCRRRSTRCSASRASPITSR